MSDILEVFERPYIGDEGNACQNVHLYHNDVCFYTIVGELFNTGTFSMMQMSDTSVHGLLNIYRLHTEPHGLSRREVIVREFPPGYRLEFTLEQPRRVREFLSTELFGKLVPVGGDQSEFADYLDDEDYLCGLLMGVLVSRSGPQ